MCDVRGSGMRRKEEMRMRFPTQQLLLAKVLVEIYLDTSRSTPPHSSAS
jgi:hypothetical protein